ncbi:putative mitochondrial protein [Vitis vinifera]|uniref:Putative mitochondrial protein n=1 Tax=Vitis vinifera TaxID=29760 RepID=A0A438HPK8_VITVI|nr:putative mitochondrial protein [Vitis vinifera]
MAQPAQPVEEPVEEAKMFLSLPVAFSSRSKSVKGAWSQKSKRVNWNHNPIVKRLEAWLKLQDSGTLTRLGVMRILRYLKNAHGKGILFTKNVNHQSIEVYTDVDWAGAMDDRRSTSGYFTFVGGVLVTWKSKKQNVVARSSAEAEFRVWL